MTLKSVSKYWTLTLLLVISHNAHGQYSGQPDSLIRKLFESKFDFQFKASSPYKLDLNSPLGPEAQIMRVQSYKSVKNNRINKGLWIRLNGKLFLYENQKIYELMELKCELKEVDIKKHDKPLRKALASLNSLWEKSTYARNIIKTLQESENKFTIAIVNSIDSYTLVPILDNRFGVLNNNAYAFQILERNENIVDYAPFDQIGSGAEIRWSMKHKKMHLAHELAHAYDANFGLLDDRLIQAYGQIIPAREIRALFHENMIRKDLKKKLRIELKNGGSAMVTNGTPYTIPLPVPARH